jgi:hypothetical protein
MYQPDNSSFLSLDFKGSSSIKQANEDKKQGDSHKPLSYSQVLTREHQTLGTKS